MNKEVRISIQGLQVMAGNGNDQTEVIVGGEYYYRNNKHFLLFEDVMEGTDEVTRNIMKISPDCMELTRKGPVSAHMLFEQNKKNVTYYYTPLGSILIGIDTSKIELVETEDKIVADVEYELDMNYEKVADCRIHMVVTSKDNRDFRLID